MGLFGKSDDSAQSGSLWDRLMKSRKHHQKLPANPSPINQSSELQQKHHSNNKIKTNVTSPSPETSKDSFRLSLPSLRVKVSGHTVSTSQSRSSCPSTEQLDSRLRTSKLQCEQLKKKVASISLECTKLEIQCGEVKEIKERLVSFQTDLGMLKRKEKVTSEIQQRIAHLEEDNFAMMGQIEHLRVKLSELKTEISPEFIYKRIDQLESDSHKLTSIALQNRRDHDRFSLDVGNQLVETFVTQQTIYEEFRRLQHRLMSVERQNQIMSDLIHFHCQSSTRVGCHLLMTNSNSSKEASTEVASSSFSPTFSDREIEKTYTSPSNIDWQFTDQGDSLFLDDTLIKDSEENKELVAVNDNTKDYYKIDFSTSKSESLNTLHLRDLSVVLSVSIMSSDGVVNSGTSPTRDHHQKEQQKTTPNQCPYERKEGHPKDDGYYSTSHDGTIATESVSSQSVVTIFKDRKERYFILARHVQKSQGRSFQYVPHSISSCTFEVKSSMDLETQLLNRRLRQRQHKQRESQFTNKDDVNQVFSDTELYGTRFYIDSDIDDDENTDIFSPTKTKPLKRSFGYAGQKIMKMEPKHVSNLPPLIEHVSERERKIEIKSTKKSKIIPPKVRPKTLLPQSPDLNKASLANENKLEPKRLLCMKPPKYIPSPKSQDSQKIKSLDTIKIKSPDSPKVKVSPKVKCPDSSKTRSPCSPRPSLNVVSPRKMCLPKTSDTKPPPIPPRPKKKSDLCYKGLSSMDYVNDPTIRRSPITSTLMGGDSSQREHIFRDHKGGFSFVPEDKYNEDTLDQEFLDQEFISELENYQLPRSSVNMLVMQHFQ